MRAASLWQFNAAYAGFSEFHSPEGDKAATPEELDRLAAWLDEPPIWH